MEIIKIILLCVVCAIVCVVVRQYRPELVPLVEVAGLIGAFFLLADYLKTIYSQTLEILNLTEIIDDGYIKILVKIIGIAILTRIGADMCSDSGNSALSDNVELAGKVVILVMCMSFVKTLATAACKFLV